MDPLGKMGISPIVEFCAQKYSKKETILHRLITLAS